MASGAWWEYAWKAGSAWLTGFAPFAEIYVAVPVAHALGLDTVSAIVWPVLGNVAPIALILAADAALRRVPWIDVALRRFRSARMEAWVERHGPAVLLLGTPWIGVWAIAVTGLALGMRPLRLALLACVSIVVYGIALSLAIAFGLGLVSDARWPGSSGAPMA